MGANSAKATYRSPAHNRGCACPPSPKDDFTDLGPVRPPRPCPDTLLRSSRHLARQKEKHRSDARHFFGYWWCAQLQADAKPAQAPVHCWSLLLKRFVRLVNRTGAEVVLSFCVRSSWCPKANVHIHATACRNHCPGSPAPTIGGSRRA